MSQDPTETKHQKGFDTCQIAVDCAVGITELLGHCLGVIGLSYDDFCRLRIEEIDEILRFNGQNRIEEGHRAWEIMRTQSFMTLSPFCKNLPGPNKLLPFPWDE